MYNHVKSTIRDFNSEHIILHVGANTLNYQKTSRQITRSVINLITSLKTDANIITVSLVAPRGDNLNNVANEVNNNLKNMCGQQNIPFIEYNETFQQGIHLNVNCI